ncbi:MAG: Mrp/NBP35 family ATP-binding protein [Desulfobacteraceae bacterium]|nr:Mrp/NBP35 family ATP-binding protein [Desulfobacteraceae bacterium]
MAENPNTGNNSRGASGTAKSTAASRLSAEQDQMITGTLAGIKHKIMIISGKGGVGKSSISAHLAYYLSEKGFQTGLLDVDLHGPSIAKILGIDAPLDLDDDRKVLPFAVNQHLKVVSMQSLMAEKDRPVIWRGPAKSGVIRQFVADVKWGDLDFLLIDSPPGTGDEPMSVAQTVPEARALIVTTPQQVALADVRKSINFCRTINLDILGMIENMGPFPCPCCGKPISLFKNGGVPETAAKMGIDYLGQLPFDPAVVKACDAGLPRSIHREDQLYTSAWENLLKKIMERL